MRKFFFLLAACILCFACNSGSHGTSAKKIANHVQIGDLYYDLYEDYTAELVTDQTGVLLFKSYQYLEGDLVIPSSVEYEGSTYTITSIGDRAFQFCSALTSVTIPDSVTGIGWDVFDGCSGLKEPVYNEHLFVYMPRSYKGAYVIPEGIQTIVIGAFEYCYKMTSVTIPESVTTIESRAFSHCEALTNVIIPESVTTIKYGAFMGCSALTSVTFPKSITSIEYSVFDGCSSLKEPVYNEHVFVNMPRSYKGAYVIPEGIQTIVGGAFENCAGLTSVTIPESVTTIEQVAFYGCTGLTSITIPESVTSIGKTTFDGCIVSPGTFQDCKSLTSITLPNSITTIADDAFQGCISLTSVTIPESVTGIGAGAFMYCTALKNITIPNSVTRIGDGAFWGTGLTDITIPNSVTEIGYSAFHNCMGLTKPIYNEHVFAYLPQSFTGEYEVPQGIQTIAAGAFMECFSLTSVTLPNSVRTIGDLAFNDCINLTSINIPKGVTGIDEYSFSGCYNLKITYEE